MFLKISPEYSWIIIMIIFCECREVRNSIFCQKMFSYWPKLRIVFLKNCIFRDTSVCQISDELKACIVVIIHKKCQGQDNMFSWEHIKVINIKVWPVMVTILSLHSEELHRQTVFSKIVLFFRMVWPIFHILTSSVVVK